MAQAGESGTALLEVKDLAVYFDTPEGLVRAVDGVSLNVSVGECCALVGESGCGKSVTALALARLVDSPPGIYADGEVVFAGRPVLSLSGQELRRLRGDRIAYVFQEPAAALNPVFRIGYQVAEAIRIHRQDAEVEEEVRRLLDMVGLPDPGRVMRAYPHQLSGGMQQRAMIAMALACRPDLLIADEPTTALDVTIQAQIIALLQRLRQRLGMAILFITHNLALVRGLTDRTYVMYAGRIVESGPTSRLLERPLHPYTQALLGAVPRLGRRDIALQPIPGNVPDPLSPPPGCRFHPRCRWALDRCRVAEPELETVGEGREVRCWRWRELAGEEGGVRRD